MGPWTTRAILGVRGSGALAPPCLLVLSSFTGSWRQGTCSQTSVTLSVLNPPNPPFPAQVSLHGSLHLHSDHLHPRLNYANLRCLISGSLDNLPVIFLLLIHWPLGWKTTSLIRRRERGTDSNLCEETSGTHRTPWR